MPYLVFTKSSSTGAQLTEKGSISKIRLYGDAILQWRFVYDRGPMSPITLTSSEFLRQDDQCFRKEETYQHRPVMFSTSGKMQGGKQKMAEEGVRAPQSEVTRTFGYQELSQEDKTSLWSLKLCPACLFLNTLCQSFSDISTSLSNFTLSKS